MTLWMRNLHCLAGSPLTGSLTRQQPTISPDCRVIRRPAWEVTLFQAVGAFRFPGGWQTDCGGRLLVRAALTVQLTIVGQIFKYLGLWGALLTKSNLTCAQQSQATPSHFSLALCIRVKLFGAANTGERDFKRERSKEASVGESF